MVERSVNLDLARQFLTGLCSCEISFWHDFESPRGRFVLLSLDWLDPANFVALSESSFSEVASTLVCDDLSRFVVVLGVHRLDLLFNDLYVKTAESVRIKLKLTKSALSSEFLLLKLI